MDGPKKLNKVIKFNEEQLRDFKEVVRSIAQNGEAEPLVSRKELFAEWFRGRKKMKPYELKLANH